MVIIEAGSDFEYGWMVGRRLGAYYRRAADLTRPPDRRSLRTRRRALLDHYPEALERMEGLSRVGGAARYTSAVP